MQNVKQELQTDGGSETDHPPASPNGKLFGVLKYRHELKELCSSLAAVGVAEIDVFDGNPGISRLRTWEERFSNYFLADRETGLLTDYREAVSNNFIVFTAVVDSSQEIAAAVTAKACGATQVACFGDSVVTSY
jgi:hypothetical protein